MAAGFRFPCDAPPECRLELHRFVARAACAWICAALTRARRLRQQEPLSDRFARSRIMWQMKDSAGGATMPGGGARIDCARRRQARCAMTARGALATGLVIAAMSISACGSGTGGDTGCTPGYSPCIPPGPDVDCAGGSGNGPRFVQGPVQVTGSDPYQLDADGDGVGCE
jgi:hypothetical protein